MKIVVAACFHNRKQKTVRSTRQIQKVLNSINAPHYIVLVDDGSTDGTKDELLSVVKNIDVVQGDGSLYWAGGMREAWKQICDRNLDESDFLLVFNDDIDLDHHAAVKMVSTVLTTVGNRNKIYVASFVDRHSGELTYGAWSRANKFKPLSFQRVSPGCGGSMTFNMNFALIPIPIIKKIGFLKPYFIHNDADFEFGLRAHYSGYEIIASDIIGYCSRNTTRNTSFDTQLSLVSRYKKLLGVKEQPIKQRLLYSWDLSKPLSPAIFISPYVKLLVYRFMEIFK